MLNKGTQHSTAKIQSMQHYSAISSIAELLYILLDYKIQNCQILSAVNTNLYRAYLI